MAFSNFLHSSLFHGRSPPHLPRGNRAGIESVHRERDDVCSVPKLPIPDGQLKDGCLHSALVLVRLRICAFVYLCVCVFVRLFIHVFVHLCTFVFLRLSSLRAKRAGSKGLRAESARAFTGRRKMVPKVGN